jgi:hypothetical protein
MQSEQIASILEMAASNLRSNGIIAVGYSESDLAAKRLCNDLADAISRAWACPATPAK